MSKKINQQIEALQELLQLEKKEDFEQFRQEVIQLEIAEKREKGICWYPLEVLKEGYTVGDRAFVIVARTAHLNEPHRIKSGAPVELYHRNTEKKSTNRSGQSGVVNFVDKNKIKIIFNSKDLPEWLHQGNLAVDLMFDERTYLEMEAVLKQLHKVKDGRLGELKSILFGEMAPKLNELKPLDLPYLNPSQIQAIQRLLAAKDVAIVHGPPGTGKTTTLVHAIKEIVKEEQPILVTAPSNAAVDLLVQRLDEKGLKVVRIGNISRVDKELIRLTLEGRLSEHPEAKNIKKVRIQAAQARREAKRFKRKFGSKERANRQDAYREARELENWAKILEERILTEIIISSDVVASTLVNANHKLLEYIKFKTVVIDEAAQALEPAIWIPISRGSKVIMAGDPFQLPPTIKSVEARKGGLGVTLLEKWMQLDPTPNFLNTQYRMNKHIMEFSNQQFYDGKLSAAPEVAEWKLAIPDLKTVNFIDTAGCGFDEVMNKETKSRFNKGEYFILREFLLQFFNKLVTQQLAIPSIALISPYREQCRFIDEEISEDQSLKR